MTLFQLVNSPLLRLLLALPILVLPVGVIVGARWADAHSWRTNLIAYQLRLPSTVPAKDVTQWLTLVAATTHPTRWSLLRRPPVCLEAVSTGRGIEFYLLVSRTNAPAILSGLRAGLPGARIEEAPHFQPQQGTRVAAEARLTTRRRPLDASRAAGTNAALVAALQPLSAPNTEIRIQWIFTSAGTPPPVHAAAAGADRWWSAYLLDGDLPADGDAVRALRLKRQLPLLRSTVRIGISSSTRPDALALLGRVWPNLHAANAPGVQLVRRWLPSHTVARRLRGRVLPLGRWPLLTNASELAALLALPTDGVRLPGLNLHTARLLPPAPAMPTTGALLAVSNYAGLASRHLCLRTTDRLRHLWALGPTGSGKSTLLTQLALQDIQAGAGVIVIDPKNDMVDDILTRLPADRAIDVIALDPGDLNTPIGLNVLRSGSDGRARELAVDHLVHVFAELWRASWGPRTAEVLRMALLTLTHTLAQDGSAFTLCEVPELLTNPAFRHFVVSQVSVPVTARGFWAAYESMSDSERVVVIGPSLNKLRAFTTRTPLRLLLGQSVGIDFGAVFRERKVVLVKLSKGTLGTEAAQLVGALAVAGVWQQCLARAGLPPEQRRPVFAYFDEFADIVRLPVSLADMLSQARGLGLAITIANQYAAQLTDEVRAAVFSQTRSQLTFQLDYDDAKLLERRFLPLTADDLMGLEQYELALRPCVDGRTLSPVTGTTLPLATPLRDGHELASQSHERFGLPRAAVEAALEARSDVARSSGRFGRKPGAPA